MPSDRMAGFAPRGGGCRVETDIQECFLAASTVMAGTWSLIFPSFCGGVFKTGSLPFATLMPFTLHSHSPRIQPSVAKFCWLLIWRVPLLAVETDHFDRLGEIFKFVQSRSAGVRSGQTRPSQTKFRSFG